MKDGGRGSESKARKWEMAIKQAVNNGVWWSIEEKRTEKQRTLCGLSATTKYGGSVLCNIRSYCIQW